jgi:hypothetical protein
MIPLGGLADAGREADDRVNHVASGYKLHTKQW